MINTTNSNRRGKSQGSRMHHQMDGGYGTDYIGRQKQQGLVGERNTSREDEYKDYENLNEAYGGLGSDSGKKLLQSLATAEFSFTRPCLIFCAQN